MIKIEDIEDFNKHDIVNNINKSDEFEIHVTQVIDLCPKELLFRNLEKYVDIPKSSRHIYSYLGTQVHKFISDDLNGKDVNPMDYYPKQYSQRDKFNKSISNYLKWKNDRLKNIEEMYSELNVVKKLDNNIVLTGTTDLIIKEDGEYKVIDFKTAKTSSMLNKYYLQLGGYAYMFKDYNINYGEVVLLGGSKYKTYSVKLRDYRDEFILLLGKAKRIIDDIRHKKTIEAKISFRCAMCSYRGICNGSDVINEKEVK